MRDFLETKASTVTDVEVPDDANLCVVGDLHGQFDDFLTALKISGLPSAKNWILFNGDFVDRGQHSLQVLLILYSMKLAFPQWVYLNRGNHEHRLVRISPPLAFSSPNLSLFLQLNSRYLFELQVKQTYDVEIFELIQETFNWMPLATLCSFPACWSRSVKHSRVKKLLVLHEGLPEYEDFSMEEFRKTPRIELPRHAEIKTREEAIVESILWSDPGSNSEMITDAHFTEHGWAPNRRGAGIYFGKKLTQRFCKANDIDMIIRSHQMVEDGYEFRHEKRLVTLFSASRYCRLNHNKGAVAIIEGSTGQVKFQNYFAAMDLLASSPALDAKYRAYAQEPGQFILVEQETAALGKIGDRLFLKRHQLLIEFSKLDTSGAGHLTIDDWAEALTRVMRVDLHWIALWPFLGYYTEEFANTPRAINEGLRHPERVEYVKFLDEYAVEVDSKLHSIQKALEEETISKICSIIFKWSTDIRDAFSKLDKKKKGSIPYHSFVAMLKRLKVGLTSSQMYDFVRSIDADGDGSVDMEEFISVFENEFNRVTTDRESDKQFVQKALHDLARLIMRDRRARTSLKTAFNLLGETAGKKGIPLDVFMSTLKTEFKVSFSDEEMKLLFDSIDQNGNGHISFKEFKTAFSPIMRSTTMRALRAVTSRRLVHATTINASEVEKPKSSSQPSFVPMVRSTLAVAFAKLQKYRNALMSIFVSLDEHGSGKASQSDLKTALSAITARKSKKPILSEDIIDSIYTTCADKDGKIDYNLFLSSFSVSKTKRKLV
jgi:protein phosphatase